MARCFRPAEGLRAGTKPAGAAATAERTGRLRRTAAGCMVAG